MTKKDFATSVVVEMSANPRKYLAGHGIGGIMLKKMSRSDILFKLGVILAGFKNFKRGAMGLKKSGLLNIKAYKNLSEFKAKAQADLEKFMAGLKGTDAETFANNTNTTVLVAYDKTIMAEGPEGDDVESKIVGQFSRAMAFDNVIGRKWKMPGAWYVLVMWAPSLVLNREEAKAKRMAKRAELKNKRESANAAKVMKKIKEQMAIAKKYKALIDANNAEIEANNANIAALQAAAGEAAAYQQNAASVIASMTPQQLGAFNAAKSLYADKKTKAAALKLVRGLGIAGAEQLLTSVSPSAAYEAKRKELFAKARKLRRKIDQLKVDLSLAPAQKRISVKSMISKYTAQYNQVQAELKRMPNGAVGKPDILAQLRAATEKAMAKGAKLSAAMDAALAKVAALTPEQRAQVKEDIIAQVSQGIPPAYAQQQAIQQLQLTEPVIDEDIDLDVEDVEDDTFDVMDLINRI